jgi:ribokinase
VVLGSVNVDLVVRTARLPVAGETLAAADYTQLMGGKGANQAVAAARAGARVQLRAAIGADAFGEAALDALAAEHVDARRVQRVDAPTGVALVVVDDSGENQIVVVAGANALADGQGVEWEAGDVALAVLEVPIEAVERFFVEARAAGATTVLNATPADAAARRLLPHADVVCVNAGELEAIGGVADAPAWVVTLGADGLRVIDADGEAALAAHEIQVVDTVGAGDATCGVLAAALADGKSLRDAAVRANAAGALAVRGPGARTAPTKAEVDELLEAGDA